MSDWSRSCGGLESIAARPRWFEVRCALAAAVIAASACGTEAPRENFGRPKPARRDAAVSDASLPADAGVSDAGGSSSDASVSDSGGPSPDASAPVLDVTAACGERPVTEGEFSRERLRTASAECALWHYCAFRTAARALEEAATHYATAREPAALSSARGAWRNAMDLWSEAELFQFGPAASVAESAGKDIYQGKGFRDRIYAWPSTSRCRVEEQVLARRKNLEPVLISGRGLFAIEYALFYSSDDTDCPDTSSLPSDWAALESTEIQKRKAEYAAAVAADVRKQVEALYDAWSPEAGNFKQTFVSASGYPDEQTALNALAWALVYVEKEVKDWKLGIPAGYTISSPVSGPESPYARVATQNIRANLRGFRSLFQGCGEMGQGVGFDDWLGAAGHAELADALLEALSGAERTIEGLGPLHEASPAKLEDAYQSVRKLTDLLKGDLFGAGSPLNLKLPASVEGDTD